MSGTENEKEGDDVGHAWFNGLAHALHHLGDYIVDVVAIVALYGIATSASSEALAQVLAASIVSVALGKRAAQAYKNRREGSP